MPSASERCSLVLYAQDLFVTAVAHAGDQGQRVTGARPVTAADMQAHAADSFKFLDFARVRRITAAMDGGATSAVG